VSAIQALFHRVLSSVKMDTFALSSLFMMTLGLCEYTSDVHWGMYVPALMLISVLLVQCRFTGAYTLRLRDLEVWVPCTSLIALIGISAFLSEDPYISLIEVESFAVLFIAIVVFSGRTTADLRAMVIAGAFPMAIFGTQGLAQALTQHVNAHAALHDSNLLAAFLTAGVAALGGCAVSAHVSGSKGHARWLWGVAALLGVGAYSAHSRGAWLAVTVSLAVTLLVTRPQTRLSYRRILLVVLAVFMVGTACVTSKTERDVAQHDHYGQSTNSRLAMWRSTGKMIEAHPMAGVGFGLWHLAYPQFRTADDTDSAGYRAHNDYLEAWASGGVLGAMSVASIPLLWTAALLLSKRRKLQDPWLFVGVSTAGGVFVLQATVNFIYHEPSVALYAGLTIGAMYAQLRGTRAIKQPSLSNAVFCAAVPMLVTVWALLTYLAMAPTLILGNPYGFEAHYLGVLMEPRVLELLRRIDPLAADPDFALGQELMLDGIVSKTKTEKVEYLSRALAHLKAAEKRQGIQASTSYKKAMITLLMPGMRDDSRQSQALSLLEESLGRNPGYWPSVNAYARVQVTRGNTNEAIAVINRATSAVPLYQRRQFQSLKDEVLTGKLETLQTQSPE
jgi:O-antigen ligase